ncbi:32695_t:CDS:2, partial [Racocetra persica]
IADLGLSRSLSDASKTNTRLADYIAYMDPQCLKNSDQKLQEIDKESDIYSLGVLLWEMSSLRPPFEEKNNLYIQIMNGCRETPILGTPPQYSTLYTECWQDDPKKRPTIDKVVYELGDDKNDGINKTSNPLNEEASFPVPMEYEVTKTKENQFHSALEVSSYFVPFASLIDIFLKLGEDIITLYKKAEYNKHLCSYFTKRVNFAVAVMKDLEIRKQENLEFFVEQTNLQLIDIITLYKKAEYNKHLCSYFTKRVNFAVAVMKDLEIRKQENLEFF